MRGATKCEAHRVNFKAVTLMLLCEDATLSYLPGSHETFRQSQEKGTSAERPCQTQGMDVLKQSVVRLHPGRRASQR